MKAIWRFSADRWGTERADRYLLGIQVAIGSLAETADGSDRVRGLGPDWRARRVQRHFVIYRLEGSTVRIIRILHDRMDLPRHLP